METPKTPPSSIRKKENPLYSLLFNIIIPSVIMMKFSDNQSLGPKLGLLVGISFPIAYGAWDYYQRREHNPISILGFCSVLLTGGLSLLSVGKMGYAIKEALIPTLIGLFVLISSKGKKPLVKTLLLNEGVMDISKLNRVLDERNANEKFNELTQKSSWYLSGSFFLSAVLNFGLAIYVLTGEPNTPEFTAQIGKMTMLSYPVITLPSLVVFFAVLFYLFRGIKNLTGLSMEELLHQQAKEDTTKKS